MSDSNVWALSVAVFGALLSLAALGLVWRKFGGKLSGDAEVLPRSVQIVISQVRKEYEGEITQLRSQFDKDIAEIKRHHEEVRMADAKKITELERLVSWLMEQLVSAGGQLPPAGQLPDRIIPELSQMAESQRRVMLVAVVDDPGLNMDLAVLRRARIPFIRLRPVTLSGFEVAINRARREGKHFRHIHIAAHTSAEGADFSGELATPEWLSERLRGVRILLIAGCESSEIGDWLAGIADYVVTMTEPVSAGTRPALSDIGIFAEVFWSSVYDGKSATEAFYAALERSPTWIGEIAEIHAGVRST